MLRRLRAWLTLERMAMGLESFGIFLFASVMFYGVVALVTACSTPAQQAKASAVEVDLCAIRAQERALELAGVLPPEAGSLRAQIEAAEDAFCAARAGAAPPD